MFKKLSLVIISFSLLFSTLPAQADGPEPITLGLGTLTSIAISPDGTRLAVGTTIGVYFYDAQTFAPQGFWDTGYWVNFLRWSPRGDVLAVIHDDTRVDFRSISDSLILWSTTVPYRRLVDFNPDGSQALVSINGKTANIFDAVTGEKIGTADGNFWSMPDWKLSVSPNKQWWSYADWFCGCVSLEEIGGLQRSMTLVGHHSGYWSVYTLAWSPDSKTLYSAGENDVIAWDIETGERLRTLNGFSPSVEEIVWSADGQHLIALAGDNIVKWNIASRLPEQTGLLDEHYRSNQLVLAPTGDAIVSAEPGGVTYYDYITLAKVRHLQIGRDITAFAISPDGQSLATAGHGTFINLWDAFSGRSKFDLRGSSANQRMLALTFSNDGQVLYALEQTGLLRRWDLTSHVSTTIFINSSCDNCGRIWDGQFSLITNRTVVQRENDIIIADDTTGDFLDRLSEYHPQKSKLTAYVSLETTAHKIAINQQGTRIAAVVGFYKPIVKIWSVETGSLLAAYPGHTYLANALAFSPDGSRLASSSSDGTIRIWPVP